MHNIIVCASLNRFVEIRIIFVIQFASNYCDKFEFISALD